MSCIDHALSRVFTHIGRNIGQHPGYYIVIPFLVSIIFATGFQQMRYEDDPEYLFSPTDGASKHERTVIDNLFPMNYSRNFNLGRITHKGRFGRVIAIAKDESNVLTKNVFDEIVQLDRLIKNMTIKFDDDPYTYEDLCARTEGKCFENDILDFVPRIEDIENHKFWLKYPLWINTDIYKAYFFPAYLGGVARDSNDLIENAKAISLMYWLDISQKHGDEKAAIWEEDFLKRVANLSFKHINVARFVSTTLRNELESNTKSLVPFFSITVIIMLVFSVATCMMSDWVRSKPWLGLLGCVSAGLGVLTAFGICVYMRVDMIGINLAAPFLMLGVGMDDAFVLLASWRRTNPDLPISERLALTYSEAAVSITITSLTNFISFLIGTYTPFPSVRIFCIYTAVAVLTTYVYHVTFFGACMVYFGRAEKRNLHGLLLIPVMPKSLAKDKGLLFRLLCTGGRNEDDPDNEEDNKEHSMMIFFRDNLAEALNRGSVKVLVIFVFLIYLAIGIYGCTQVREGLDRRKLSRDDSYSVAFYDYEDRFFREYPYRIQVVINDTLNYADPRDQEKVEAVLSKFESSTYVGNRSMTESWLRSYLEFLNQEDSFLFLQALNVSEKGDFYRGLRDVFLKFPMTEAFRNDVVFNEDGTEIIASRYMIQTYDIKDANMEKEMLIELRQMASSAPLNVTIFHQLFIFFDQFILVREISLQTITVAAIVMMVISMLFIPSLSCAIWVAFSIISIEVGVIGYMTLWDVNLDSISMINLIMCIGFSVDFSAHISYAYISCGEETAADRVRSALYSLGLPIFQGSVSTILGIIALAFAPSYVFLVFFKTVFLVMLFGATHGVLLLPVLLSITDLCQPKSKSNKSPSGTLNQSYPGLDLTGVPHPFLIPDKTFDGKKITASVNPIFIPRPSLTGGIVPTTGLSPAGSGIVDEDSGAGSKSSASSETSVGRGDPDYGLGTSGEDCSEGSWGKKGGKSSPTTSDLCQSSTSNKQSGQMVVTSSETCTNLSSGLINHSSKGTTNLQRHLYTRWPPSGLTRASGVVGGEDHVNHGYISDSGEIDNYDPPLPVMSHIQGHLQSDQQFNRSTINRLSAYHESADEKRNNSTIGWPKQLITNHSMTKGSINSSNKSTDDSNNYLSSPERQQIKHRSGTGSRELINSNHYTTNNQSSSSNGRSMVKTRNKTINEHNKDKFTKSYTKHDKLSSNESK